MRLNLENTELLLQENQPLRLINGKGAVVRCLAGTAWLTVAGDATDCVLEPGQERQLENDGLALIEPMGKQATIRLQLMEFRQAGLIDSLLKSLAWPALSLLPNIGRATVWPEYSGLRGLKNVRQEIMSPVLRVLSSWNPRTRGLPEAPLRSRQSALCRRPCP